MTLQATESRSADSATAAPPIDAATRAAVRAAGLVYVSDAQPGIRRLGRSHADFHYVDAGGKAVRDEDTLARIRKLAIPPAYEDVWISPKDNGHLQATGRDARGRKQYRYHADWRSLRDGHKFDRMIAFGEALTRLRRRVSRDLALPGLPREKVLALVVALLDVTRIRIGNARYAAENQSFGLTTLKSRHARFVRDGRLKLEFDGKGGTAHEVTVDDRRLAKLVRHCQQLPGQALFQYLDDGGGRHAIDSGQVNQYLGEAMGEAFTAKDFRTWSGTLKAIALMGVTPLPEPPSERALAGCVMDAVRAVAAELRNTPAVCRRSYINPAVFEAWRNGRLHKHVKVELAHAPRKAEQLGLAFLRAEARRASRGKTSRTAS